MTALNTRAYWANYERCLNRVAAEARTVDSLIAILNEHYQPSCGEAFFPDGADRDLRSTLLECGWQVRWSRASYWFAICEPEGADGITFTEGDIDRGVALHGQARTGPAPTTPTAPAGSETLDSRDDLTDEDYAAADRIDRWLEDHPGWHSPSRIARGAHLDTAQARKLLIWLDRQVLVAATGNGCWRTYSRRR